MKPLFRKKFLDLTWNATDLDLVAQYWLKLHEVVARSRKFSRNPAYSIEIHLRGFPRHQADSLAEELTRRSVGSDLSLPRVERLNPDTLVLTTNVAETSENRFPTGLGLPLLAGEQFDGLYIEVRFRLASTEYRRSTSTVSNIRLILAGELRQGAVLIKEIWRSGSTDIEHDRDWFTAKERIALLGGLEEYRQSGNVSLKLAKTLFRSTETENSIRRMGKIIEVPLDEPRLLALTIRWAAFIIYVVALGFISYRIAIHGEWLWLVPGVPISLIALPLALSFVLIEYHLFFTAYRVNRAWYARYYKEPVRYVPANSVQLKEKLVSRSVQKHKIDLEIAGFTHAGDIIQTPAIANQMLQVYYAPDGITYLSLLFRFAMDAEFESPISIWPPTVSFCTQTFFPDGWRIESIDSPSLACWWGRTPTVHAFRVFSHVTDPIEFFRLHTIEVAKIAEEEKETPIRHESLERWIKRQVEIHEEERQQYALHPYSRSDHLRWYLQLTRREYRG